MENKIILVDFDGTCVTHDFPNIGKDIGAVKVLKLLIENGHKIILFTMRSDIENPLSNSPEIIPINGDYLSDAVKWFDENNIPLYGINTNPTQSDWTHSPKAYGHLIIDDTGLGIPLINNKSISNRPFVDWIEVEKMLINLKYINNN